MTLFWTMLPLYLFGNLHCLGMCGPLVMLIGQHRYSYFYFFGRTLSFALAGMLAGELGSTVNLVFSQYNIASATSLLFGSFIFGIGLFSFMGWSYPGNLWLSKKLASMNKDLSLLILKDTPWALFLFGFFTLALPCGQTLVVFSACALFGDPIVGLMNGAAFALLTSPSLWLAMRAHTLLYRLKPYYNKLMGGAALLVGALAIARGLAEAGVIEHLVINPQSTGLFHIVIY